jgi:hypothetical protein
LSFDYAPAEIVLNILETPNITYQEIMEKINIRQFQALYNHHSQSFYTTPLNKERMAMCLSKASSNEPRRSIPIY